MSRIRTRPTLARSTSRARQAAPTSLGLSDSVRRWALENLIDGVPHADLVRALESTGVPRHVAVRDIALLGVSPLLEPLREARLASSRAEQVLSLVRGLEPESIERREKPTAEVFYTHYFHANRPCIFTNFTEGWPARAWTPESLVGRLEDAEIEVVRGRDAYPVDYDRRSRELAVRMPVSEYVRLVRERSPTNDLYSVAHNKNMERAAFVALLEDVVVDESYFDPARLTGGTSLWLGPAGTVTPLHHDTTNILFCQLYGRKRMTLVSPLESAMLGHVEGYYSTLPADALPTRSHTVELGPGDALFLPVGWWHEVRALEISISFSLLAFRRPNAFSEYGPGFLG